MSSPVQPDFDSSERRLTRWANEPHADPSAAVLAAADRLRRQREHAPRPLADIEAAMTEFVRENWSPPALDPVTMEPPPRSGLLGPSWGMIARVLGAVGCASAIALFVAGGVPLSSVDTSANSDRQTSGNQVSSNLVSGNNEDVRPIAFAAPGPAAMRASSTPSEQRIVGGSPAFSSNAVIGVAVASTAQPRELPQAVTLPAPPAAAAPLEPAPALRAIERALDHDEITILVKRGQELAAQGDIAAARLLLRRAAEAGDAQAMQALGATYDSTALAKLRVIGVAPDDGRARAWYQRAAAAGAPDAGRRLEQLAGRTQ